MKMIAAVITIALLSGCAPKMAPMTRTKLSQKAHQISAISAQGYIDQGMAKCYAAPEGEQRMYLENVAERCLKTELKSVDMFMTQAEMNVILNSAEVCALTSYHRMYRDKFTVDKLSTKAATKCLKQRDIFDETVALGL
jgi:type IV pilus biogenesis protein CpaD/CtpE